MTDRDVPSIVSRGVILRRRPSSGRWATETWEVAALIPPPANIAPGSALNPAGGLVYAGVGDMHLKRGETGAYRDNLASEHPLVWVAMRPAGDAPPHVAATTAHPGEGEALAGDVGLVVEAIAMPQDVAATVAAFVATFHVERPFFKRSRTIERRR